MRFTTILIAILFLMSTSSVNGQVFKNITIPSIIEAFLKDLTFEVGFNRSKIFNTKKISSFEADGKFGSYIVNIKKEYYPITTNYNMSLGCTISKNHHIRLRHARNSLGSVLIGNFNLSSFESSILTPIRKNHTLLVSKSLRIIYEYHAPYYEGNFVFGAGLERQKNKIVNELLLIPGIIYRSYSFHSHIGYLSELSQFIGLHGKIFSTYYFPNNRQIYDSPIDSKYVPLQIGFEIALRLNIYNGFRHPRQNKKKRRKRNMYFIKPY